MVLTIKCYEKTYIEANIIIMCFLSGFLEEPLSTKNVAVFVEFIYRKNLPFFFFSCLQILLLLIYSSLVKHSSDHRRVRKEVWSLEVNTGLTPGLESLFFFFSGVSSKDKPVTEGQFIINILQSLTLEELRSL